MDLGDDLDEALGLLRAAEDVVGERPSAAEAPGWARRRGWDRFLEELPDDALFEAERDPAAWLAGHGPAGLRELAGRASALTARYRCEEPATEPERRRHVKARKQVQIEAFGTAADGFGLVARVVDLGSGHGHLTRALAERLAPGEAVGIERESEHVDRARALGGAHFVRGDATRVHPRAGDLVVGLHPCGQLGDALVQRARPAAGHVLMVSCCFQKVATPQRAWLSTRRHSPVVPRTALGLANLSPVSFRGSGSLAAKREWRRTRLALRFALEARDVPLAPGDEGRGVTKERIQRGLAAAAERAFTLRGLGPAEPGELARADAAATAIHGRVARFALPRHALARVLELAIVLDRAHYLHEGGWHVEVRALFPAVVSPRNLAIVASARR